MKTAHLLTTLHATILLVCVCQASWQILQKRRVSQVLILTNVFTTQGMATRILQTNLTQFCPLPWNCFVYSCNDWNFMKTNVESRRIHSRFLICTPHQKILIKIVCTSYVYISLVPYASIKCVKVYKFQFVVLLK